MTQEWKSLTYLTQNKSERFDMKRTLILASSSPRRREILEKMGLEFEIITSDYEETLESPDFTYEKIEELAFNKAKSVADMISTSRTSVVLGADTVVVLNDKILGKPQDKTEAINMLKQLSGKKHSVVTSICVINSTTSASKILSTTSYVEFKTLTDELIMNYVENCKPMDKAGSYGIQELPEGFINCVEGSFENIMGLCPITVEEILGKF